MKNIFTRQKQAVLIAFFVFYLGSLTHGFAQTQPENWRHHEINVEINDALPVTIFYTFTDAFVSGIRGVGSEQIAHNSSSSPYYSLNYNYYLSPKFAVGLVLGYYNHKKKETYRDTDTGNETDFMYTSHIISLAANVKYIYIKKRNFQFYGRGLVGAGFIGNKRTHDASTENVSQVIPMFQIMPLGIRYGGSFAGFLELGFGLKGFIGVGLSYSF